MTTYDFDREASAEVTERKLSELWQLLGTYTRRFYFSEIMAPSDRTPFLSSQRRPCDEQKVHTRRTFSALLVLTLGVALTGKALTNSTRGSLFW